MSVKVYLPDNVAIEIFLGRPGNEFSHCHDWQNASYEEFHARISAYLIHYDETTHQEVVRLAKLRTTWEES